MKASATRTIATMLNPDGGKRLAKSFQDELAHDKLNGGSGQNLVLVGHTISLAAIIGVRCRLAVLRCLAFLS